MDFWITMAGSAAVLEALIIWQGCRMLQKQGNEAEGLQRTADRWRESSNTWMERYREAADQAEANAAARDSFEDQLRVYAKRLAEEEDAKAAALAGAELWKGDAEEMKAAKEAAELEAERCRKECAMHEAERRQLEQRVRNLRNAYAELLKKETDAEMLLRREMDNFLRYAGSEEGQVALHADND